MVWREIDVLREIAHAFENQRDLNDVDWRENYLLLLVTHPPYQEKIPGAEKTRRREFSYVDVDGFAARRNSSRYAFSGKAPTGPGGPKR
jgi:hypothetical protein